MDEKVSFYILSWVKIFSIVAPDLKHPNFILFLKSLEIGFLSLIK